MAQPGTWLPTCTACPVGGVYPEGERESTVRLRSSSLLFSFSLFSICQVSHQEHIFLQSDRKPVSSLLTSGGPFQEFPACPSSPHLRVWEHSGGPVMPTGTHGCPNTCPQAEVGAAFSLIGFKSAGSFHTPGGRVCFCVCRVGR